MTKNTGKKLNATMINPASYQLIPLTKVLLNKFKGILICDGVGVGKTISAGYIVVYLSKKTKKPSLIICNPFLIDKWILELSTKFNVTAFPIRSIDDFDTAFNEIPYYKKEDLRCYILSSSIFTKDLVKKYGDIKDLFSCIIIDEIHNFRNRQTKSYKNCYNFIKYASNYKIGLTATPINNRLDDLCNEFNLLFSNYELDSWQFTLSEITTQKAINLLSSIMTRYTKERLKIHFTKRNIITEFIDLSDEQTDLVNNKLSTISNSRTTSSYPLELITYYRLANSSFYAFSKSLGLQAISTKSDMKLNKLMEILNGTKENKFLIFCEFEETVNYLTDNLSQFDYSIFSITGQTPLLERKSIISMFRNTRKGILIMTSVGTEGLDLQFCSALVNYDLNWNPMVIEQRIGRIDRIGQKKKEITIHNFWINNSIDDRIIKVLENKLRIISDVFNIENNPITTDQANNEIINVIYNDELNNAQKLIHGSEIISMLDYDDYDILRKINTNFCYVEELKKSVNHSEEIEWIIDDKISKDWISELTKNNNQLINLLQYYS